MARVNTTNPLVRETSRRRKAALGDQSKPSRPLGTGETTISKCSSNSNAYRGDAIQGSSQKQKLGTSTMFDIFPDPAIESGSSASNTPTKQRKSRTLKSTKANSLLLPIHQRPRDRTGVKVETDDYDKENDATENVPEPFTAVAATALQRSPTRRTLTTGRPPSNNRVSERPSSEGGSESEEEDATSETSFDSLDDFVVSDNDEISYHASSDSESEEEKAPTPPKATRKRLLRGRKPPSNIGTATSSRNASASPSREDATSKEPLSFSKLAHRDFFQHDQTLSSQLDGLKLEDRVPATELEEVSPESTKKSNPLFSDTREKTGRPQTPPLSPSKQRLQSPTKQRTRIPPTPHRESVDAFWNQDETNDWIDRHSPRKEKPCGRSVIDLLKDFDLSDKEDSSRDDSSSTEPDSKFRLRAITPNTPKSPSKTAVKKAEAAVKREAKARRLSFDNKKVGLAETFLQTLDDAVSGGKVTELAQASGGIKIVWSKTLLKTAGRAHWKAERIRSLDVDGKSTTTCTHHASIELAERIIDDVYRLINTVTHEYCHLANYMISNVTDHPHGASFKAWGSKCSAAMKDHPLYGGKIEVTTKHNYEIEYKYVWECSGCIQTYGRHSKSIDTDRQRCGACRNKLVQIKPKPRNVSPKKNPITPTVQKKMGLELAKNLGGFTL